MTIEQSSAHIGGSVVNSLAHQKLLSLRQREADAYWDAEANRRMETSSNKKTRAARLKSLSKPAREDHKLQEKIEFTRQRNAAINMFISLEGIQTDWTPENEVPAPNPKSQESFAEQAGIDPAHYKEVESGNVAITLDDAVKISRAFDIDISTFLLPDVENLEKGIFFDLRPIHPVHGPIYMYEWVMWIMGQRPLPGQDKSIWRKTTSMPAAYVESVHGGRRRDPEEVDKELLRIKNSDVSAYEVLLPDTPRKDAAIPRTPYENSPTPLNFTIKTSKSLIKASLAVATRIKVSFETSHRQTNLKDKRDKFSNGIGIIRDNIVTAVRILLSLGK